MKPYAILASLCAALIIAACAPLDVAAPPVERLQLPKKTDTTALAKGRELYASACTKCHGPARIDRGSDEHWAGRTLPKMCRWSKLTPEETALLSAYVITARHAMPPETH